MAARDLDLLLRDVAADLYQLHAVEERLRDARDVVGRGYEHYLREVVVAVEVVVVESGVLLRVEHLQQGCRRVSLIVGSHFVDFVEHEHRVALSAFLQRGYDAPRHRA